VVIGAAVIEQLPLSAPREYWYPPQGNVGPWLMVLAESQAGEVWRGFFSLHRGWGSEWSLVTWPNESRFFVAAGGFGYWVDEGDPEGAVRVDRILPLRQAVAVPGPALMVAVSDFTTIHIITPGGQAWETKRIGWDFLKIAEVSGSMLKGTVYNAIEGRDDNYELDLDSREVRGGSRNIP
jgi:hypothetical protein